MTNVVDRTATPRGLGHDVERPDAVAKVAGRFEFSSDLWAEGMLWGRTLRSPHASARIRRVDVGPALAVPGVHAVLTADDVPGAVTYGLEHADQPVLARDVVRYVGEPVAVVAADHPDTARRAAAAVVVDYEVLHPLTDPEAALTADPIHPDGNIFRHQVIRHGDPDAVEGDVTVEGTYEVGMQDQAFLGTESALAVPDDGGVELHIATQWLHVDQAQVAACLGLPASQVRLVLAGVGGAFGAREDLSLQVHICLLALRTGRPVKMVYDREESFYGHVHRHPCRLWFRHHATPAGDLVKVEARLLFDGGAYASSSTAVLANGVSFACGPYAVPHARVEGWAVRTNNPPCGAMRGFGVVQACFGHESQMDALAAALGMDPVELRLRNAHRTGDRMITGQVISGTAPVEACIRAAAEPPLPPVPDPADDDVMLLPGGAGRTVDRGQVRRGVGFAVSIKNIAFSEGFDDYSTAAVTLRADGSVLVKSACAEVGQGFVTIAAQIAREVLGLDDVTVDVADTDVGSAGSTSASRQTWMSGGAVEQACRAVRDDTLARAGALIGASADGLDLREGAVVDAGGAVVVTLADLLGDDAVHREMEFRHAPTQPLDADGQGDAHVSYAFAAHRAVVDVDPELGLVRVVQITTGQDVGRALNPAQVVGQIEGGIAQGLGLAVMEEVLVRDGLVRNPSFTDYLIPTALDMPPVEITLIEEPEPGAPFGAKGVGEPPTISSTPAVVAAIRAATGLPLTRVPVRPADIALPPPVTPTPN